MSKSVRKGGAVCGPAPLKENIKVVELPVRQSADRDVAGITSVPRNPEAQDKLPIELADARAALVSAVRHQRYLEERLERICSSLLVAGEQIPTLDQTDLSMLQEAYINASTARSVAAEKTMILQHRVSRLSAMGQPNDDSDWLMAA